MAASRLRVALALASPPVAPPVQHRIAGVCLQALCIECRRLEEAALAILGIPLVLEALGNRRGVGRSAGCGRWGLLAAAAHCCAATTAICFAAAMLGGKTGQGAAASAPVKLGLFLKG